MASELLNLLFSFQPDDPAVAKPIDYHRNVRTFIRHLNNVSPAVLSKGADTEQDILQLLNPAVNSIAYLFVLRARITSAGESPKTPKQIPDQLKPGGSAWNAIVGFLETFDRVQMRYMGPDWRGLLEYVEKVAQVLGSPGLAIAPIRSAMLRLDPSTGTFTSNHLHFIRLCMETRSYTAALPILDNYIHSLPTALPDQTLDQLESSVPCAEHSNSGDYITTRSGHSDKLTVADVQEYYLLGAMAYIGLRKWSKAILFLEHVLATPTFHVANGLMLEAYKKWVLVSCLAHGSFSAEFRGMNGTALKVVRGASKAYEALAHAFLAVDESDIGGDKASQKFRSQVFRGTAIWDEDGNGGLVRELVEHQSRMLISNLSFRFSAIPIAEVAKYIGGSVEKLVPYVEKLITDGQLNARIEDSNKPEAGMVLRFYLDPTQGPLAKTEKQQQRALLEQTQRTSVLAQQVKSADYRLSLAKEYIDHVKRQNKKLAPNGTGDAMETNWDSQVDEDMMGDLQ